jgi:Heliorhodopsin
MTKAAALKDKKSNPISMLSLNKWNVWLAGIHALQGVIILILSTTHVFPVQTSYLTLDPVASDVAGHPVLATATRHLFDINLAYAVAIFFFLSAIAHASIAWWYRPRYEADLKKKINKARWIEYALSASVMMVAIAVLSGVADLSTLIAIFVLDAVMNLCGLAMEVYNQGKAKPNWLVYSVGVIAGIVPWVIFAVYVWGANIYGSGNIPTFVYWIYLSMFLFFSSFAVNMYLQYKKVGNWKDYLYGERVYMILSLVAKTLLAWQVFAGALRP